MSATTVPSQRRTLAYQSLAEVLDDARRLAAAEHATVGRWTYAQILDHIASAMDMAFDGSRFQAAWWLRVLVAPLVKNYVLTHPMKAGFRLPRRAASLLPDPATPLDSALRHLESSVARFDSEQPAHPHPFLGRLTREQYVQLHLRHAALHMSFVVPASAST